MEGKARVEKAYFRGCVFNELVNDIAVPGISNDYNNGEPIILERKYTPYPHEAMAYSFDHYKQRTDLKLDRRSPVVICASESDIRDKRYMVIGTPLSAVLVVSPFTTEGFRLLSELVAGSPNSILGPQMNEFDTPEEWINLWMKPVYDSLVAEYLSYKQR